MTAKCSTCGIALPTGQWEGLCPACIVRVSLGALFKPDQSAQRPSGDPSSQAQDDPSPGPGCPRRFGQYQLLKELGRGGMGIVYQARQPGLERLVALKVLPTTSHTSPRVVERFRIEAKLAGSLQHPHIVAIHDVGEQDDQPFFSMEYVEGLTLADYVRGRPLPARRAAAYLKVIAEAVEYAHQRGVLHRDLKPSNILIDARDQPRITDFGLGKFLNGSTDLTLSGQMLGSPGYMPPEQLASSGNAIGPFSDVYALGAILYHLLTGHPPFRSENIETTLLQVLNHEPVSPRTLVPSVPTDLEIICLKCLEKNPARRYPTAQALADDLGRFLAGEAIQARLPSALERSWRWWRRHPTAAASAALGACFLFSIAVIMAVAAYRLSEKDLAVRRNAYVADLNLAQQAVEAHNFGRAIKLLERHRPALPSLFHWNNEIDLRGWEWRYLWRQCQSDDLCTLGSHSNLVSVLAFSPNGEQLATGDQDGGLKLWHLPSRKEIATRQLGAAIFALAFSPDGKTILTGGKDKSVRVWDTATLAATGPPLAQADWVVALAFSATGNVLEVFTRQGQTSWRWPDRTELDRVEREFTRQTACSRDGQRVAVGRDNGTIDLLAPNQPGSTNTIMTGEKRIIALAFSFDGEFLVSAGSDRHARVWDCRTGRQRALLGDHRSAVQASAFSPDGLSLITASADQTMLLWDLQSGERRAIFRGHHTGVTAVSFSPDGTLVASGDNQGAVKLWNAAGQAPPDFAKAFVGPLKTFVLAPDGTSLDTFYKDGSCTTWTPVSLQESAPQTPPPWAIKAGAASRGGTLRAASIGDGVVKIWEPATLREVATLTGTPDPVRTLSFSPDSRGLVAAGTDGWLQWWDLASARLIGNTRMHSASMTSWMAFSGDGRRLALAYDDGMIEVWNALEKTLLWRWRAHGQTVRAVALTHDGRLLATGGADGVVKLWRLPERREIARLSGALVLVTSLSFTAEGDRLAVGTDDGTIKLWDVVTGQEVGTLRGHRDPSIYGLAFHPDGNTLISVSLKEVCAWHAASHAEIARNK